ncbi:MAG: flippase-like domain-containing protein [Methanosarcinaceae archaeon]|nr:flippase-like domain-containing protein [Methanosarcinaceae archaeon]
MNAKRPLDTNLLLSKKTIFSFIVSFSVLFLLIKNIDVNEVIEVTSNLDVRLYLAAFAVHYSSFMVRGLRWQKLLNTIHVRVSALILSEMVFLSWFANSIVPAKIGDVYRSYMLKKYTETPISASIGTIVVERIVDIAVLMILLTITGTLVFKEKMPEEIAQSLEIGYILVGFVALLLILVYMLRHHIVRIIPERFIFHYDNLHDGVYGSFSRPTTFVYVVFFTLLSWTLESGRFLLVTMALGLDLNLPLVIFVVLASSLLTAIPLTPAGLGAVEVSIVFILGAMGVDTAVGTSVALLDRLISYWSILASGAVVYMISDKT